MTECEPSQNTIQTIAALFPVTYLSSFATQMFMQIEYYKYSERIVKRSYIFPMFSAKSWYVSKFLISLWLSWYVIHMHNWRYLSDIYRLFNVRYCILIYENECYWPLHSLRSYSSYSYEISQFHFQFFILKEKFKFIIKEHWYNSNMVSWDLRNFTHKSVETFKCLRKFD